MPTGTSAVPGEGEIGFFWIVADVKEGYTGPRDIWWEFGYASGWGLGWN